MKHVYGATHFLNAEEGAALEVLMAKLRDNVIYDTPDDCIIHAVEVVNYKGKWKIQVIVKKIE